MFYKKKIIVFIFILLPALIMADMFTSEFELGAYYYLNNTETNIYTIGQNAETHQSKADLELLVKGRVYLYETVFVGGGVVTVVEQLNIANYMPFFSMYPFEIGIKMDGLELVYEHLCAHTSNVEGYSKKLLTGVDKAYNRVGLIYKGRTGR